MAGITFGNFRGKGCECSKCEGVVLCAARNLLPDSIKPTHYTVRREWYVSLGTHLSQLQLPAGRGEW